MHPRLPIHPPRLYPPRLYPPHFHPRLHPHLHRTYTTHLPTHPPPDGTTNLTPTRHLIELHGIDAPKFLQGVTTTNIPTLTHPAYSCFLNAQGRILFDVFIYPITHSPTWHSTHSTTSDPAYFIECDADSTPHLLTHIKRYKLRSKFTIRAIPPGEWDVWSIWDDTTHRVASTAEISCVDARAPGLGTRVVLYGGAQPELRTLEAEVPVCGGEVYKLRRMMNGVPEGQREIVSGVALPAEYCVDYMGGVDFRKGCYVGQELTIRTQHRGVVRKRVLPVVVYEGEVPGGLRYEGVENGVVEGAEIRRVGGKGRPVGKWLGGVGNVGLALCRLETMTGLQVEGGGEEEREVGEFEVEGGKKVKAFVPGWHLLGGRSGVGGED